MYMCVYVYVYFRVYVRQVAWNEVQGCIVDEVLFMVAPGI